MAGLAGRVEADLIARAEHVDADQLRRLSRHILTVVAPEIGEAAEGAALDRQERRDTALRAFSITPDGAGTWWVRGRLDTEAAATIRAALDPLSAPNPAADGTPDPRSAPARRAEALTEVCRRALRAGRVGGHGGQPATVIVHIPLAALTPAARAAGATNPSHTTAHTDTGSPAAAGTTDTGPGGHASSPAAAGTGGAGGTDGAFGDSAGGGLGYLADDSAISPALARKLACDCDLIPAVLGTDGAVLDLGRTHRQFTGATRRALALRDRGCAFPGCDRPPEWCDAHHVLDWHQHGPTRPAPVTASCSAGTPPHRHPPRRLADHLRLRRHPRIHRTHPAGPHRQPPTQSPTPTTAVVTSRVGACSRPVSWDASWTARPKRRPALPR